MEDRRMRIPIEIGRDHGRSIAEIIDRDQFEVRLVQRSPKTRPACAAKPIDRKFWLTLLLRVLRISERTEHQSWTASRISSDAPLQETFSLLVEYAAPSRLNTLGVRLRPAICIICSFGNQTLCPLDGVARTLSIKWFGHQ
jgi:hypothetical protein